MRIAVFGQAAFGRDVMDELLAAGHEIAAVYAPPPGRRPDPLAEAARARGLPLLRPTRLRHQGRAIPEHFESYARFGAELNVMAYTTVILPPEMLDAPAKGSLCFHPSLLPRYRGGAAIAWQIIYGERESGVTVFQPDAEIDTGPVVVQQGGIEISGTDTTASLYFEKLYPLGVAAMAEAVAQVAAGTARPVPQDESRATAQGLIDDAVARIDWQQPAAAIDRLVRGCDPRPGALGSWQGGTLRLFASRLAAPSTASPHAPPGTVLGKEGGRLRIAARDGCLEIGAVRLGSGPKLPVAECDLAAGDRVE